MMRHRISYLVFLGLCLLCLLQAWYFYPLLPERVASHFGPTGQPDAWTTKVSFLSFDCIVVGGLAALFSVIGLLMEKIPPALMNLPNRDYWLAEENRKETILFLSSSFFWFASATMMLLLDVFQQTFQVQLGKAKTLTHPVLSLGIYISFTLIMTIGLLLKFFRKKM